MYIKVKEYNIVVSQSILSLVNNVNNTHFKVKSVRFFGRLINMKLKPYSVLKKIYGIGYFKSLYYLSQYGLTNRTNNNFFNVNKRFSYFEYKIINSILVDRDLKNITFSIINKYIESNTYRGSRRVEGLPTHGQRTHSNAKTVKSMFRSAQLRTTLARAGIVGAKRKKGKLLINNIYRNYEFY